MARESPVTSVIQDFEKGTPFFVVYGAVPNFEKVISDFRAYCQCSQRRLYITLDLELAKRNTRAATLFEIVQQLGYWCWLFETISNTNENTILDKLQDTLTLLHTHKEEIPAYSPEDQLSEFWNFADKSFFPMLKELYHKDRPMIIELNRFEKVSEWGVTIRDFLERLAENLPEAKLRFVLFDKSPYKPRLYYGSAEEESRTQITFYKLLGTMILQKPLESGVYDVFLVYRSEDRQQVEEVAAELQRRGINPWIESLKLPPGRTFQEEIERILPMVKGIVAFVGQSGMGPWQDLEVRTLISRAVQREMLVILVLLPGARSPDLLPLFLQDYSWIEFTKGIDDAKALERFVSAVKTEHLQEERR